MSKNAIVILIVAVLFAGMILACAVGGVVFFMMREGKLGEAEEHHKNTAEALDRSIKEAEQAKDVEKLAQQSLDRLAKTQEAHHKAAGEIEDKLGQFPKKFGEKSENVKKAKQWLGLARQDMKEAGQMLENRKAGDGAYSQKRALEYLEAAKEAVEKASGEQTSLSPERQLAQKQKDVANRRASTRVSELSAGGRIPVVGMGRARGDAQGGSLPLFLDPAKRTDRSDRGTTFLLRQGLGDAASLACARHRDRRIGRRTVDWRSSLRYVWGLPA